jgi:3-oxoacyl-[acyl-carrier-protein] synthase III
MACVIKAIEYYLPERTLSNEQLASEFPDWSIEKIQEKTGISQRHIAADSQYVSDLATKAAEKLFQNGICKPSDIDFILFCTQSPDYALPTTACLLQHSLGIPTHAGALDFNLGCSGYVYGLSLAKALIATEQAHCVLLVTAETYSKYIDPADKSVRTIFGDGASASLISGDFFPSGVKQGAFQIGQFVFGTDGRGGQNLIVKNSGAHALPGNGQSSPTLYMNGPEIFSFTLNVVPSMIEQLLIKANLTPDDINFYIFHQANLYMLEHLRKRINIPLEKTIVCLETCGNTVSSTIPIAFKEANNQERFRNGMRIMLVGFGVGYSWGATIVTCAE